MEKMKEKLMMVAVMVAFVIGFLTIARAEEVIIRGYATGEFAIKGQTEKQLEKFVSEVRSKQNGGQLEITVIGSADMTGRSVTNDQLAKVRAEQVAAYLTTVLPKARVISWSQGDQADVRRVRVKYTITPALAAQSAAPIEASYFEKATRLLLICSGVASTGVGMIIFYFGFKWLSRYRKAEAKAIAGRQRKVLETVDQNIKEVECAGYVTIVKRVQRGDKWVWELPFRHVRADQSLGDKIWNENFRKLESSLARCLGPGSKFESQITGLLKSKEIRKI